MYNIALENGYWVEIEGYKCVSLGHNLKTFDKTNEILEHKYFGTNKVIEDIEKFKSNSLDKHIVINDHQILRDQITNRVVGICKK